MRVTILGRRHAGIERAAELAGAAGAQVRFAETLASLLEALRSGRGADVLLVDVVDDVALVRDALTAERFHLPIVAYGVDAQPRDAARAIKAGAREFLPLPPEAELIAEILGSLAEGERRLVCEDPRMRAVLDTAARFAAADATVLVTGESGTGKEMVARHVHRHSRRADRPFVSVNCAAIPENLLESELFGHEKGAFTGAIARRVGKFEEAHGGTLLLDEVSEMEPRLQAKLLRVIQEREIDRVGGRHPVKIDIRLIATSNRDLARAVADGSFREDLYYRLNVLAIMLPPLRERPGDVAALAQSFALRFSKAHGVAATRLSAAALDRLMRHAWPGNVRELENTMQRAVLLARGEVVDADAISFQPSSGLHGADPRANDHPSGSAGGEAPVARIGMTVAEAERDLILGTLRHTSGNRTQAATLLGISIRTLRNKLQEYSHAGMAIVPPGRGAGTAGGMT